MFLLSVIPFIFAHLLTTRVLRQRQTWLVVPMAYALGLTLFLFSVNVLFHVLSLRYSVYLTLGLMTVLSGSLLPLQPAMAERPVFGRFELAVVVVLAMTAFFRAFFYQLQYVDDDVFPHAPLMALYLQDVFPPRNPLYPDMPYLGHYGRDLLIAALSVLFNGEFFRVQYVITALNQCAIVLLVYFISRRCLGSPRSALLGVSLGFLGGWGLMDVFYNNNSVVYLLLFLNAYLYWIALARRDTGSKVVAVVGFTTYSVVYETHFGVLLVVCMLFPLLLMLRRRRWRIRYVGISAFIVGASFIIALYEGGTLTDVGHRYLRSGGWQQGKVETSALVTQEVSMRFPKRHLIITSFDGTQYPLMSLRLLQEAGYFVLFLPATALVMFAGRRYWGLLLSLIAMVAILIPATVDFGVHNVESYRFLFFGGVGAAISFGMCLGICLDRFAEGAEVPRWAKLGLLCVLVIACWGSFWRTATSFWHVIRRPAEYYWRAEEWACTGFYSQVCDPADAVAAMKLRPSVRKGERLMIYVDHPNPLSFTTDSMLAALSGAFLSGRGVRVSTTGEYKIMDYMEPAGFRAIAFWNTADLGLLYDIGADYLLLDPLTVPRRVYDRLRNESHLRMILRDEDARRGTVREVYKVDRSVQRLSDTLPPDLKLRLSQVPSPMERARFYEIPMEVISNDSAFEGRIKVGSKVFYGDLPVNGNDEIRHELILERKGPGRWSGSLFFVAPFESGTYRVSIYVICLPAPIEKAVFSIQVQ